MIRVNFKRKVEDNKKLVIIGGLSIAVGWLLKTVSVKNKQIDSLVHENEHMDVNLGSSVDIDEVFSLMEKIEIVELALAAESKDSDDLVSKIENIRSRIFDEKNEDDPEHGKENSEYLKELYEKVDILNGSDFHKTDCGSTFFNRHGFGNNFTSMIDNVEVGRF